MVEGPAKNQVERKTFPVRKAWFDAWYEGNSIIPQASAGILATLADTILHQEGFDLREFANSVLTEEQKKFSGDRMSAMHAKKGVSLSTKDGVKFFGPRGNNDAHQIVEYSALEELWIKIREGIIHKLVYYKSRDYGTTLTDQEIQQEAERFLKGQDNPDRLEDLKSLAKITRELMRTDAEVREFLKNYRERFGAPLPEGVPSYRLWDKLYASSYRNMLERKITAAGLDVRPENLKSFLKFFA